MATPRSFWSSSTELCCALASGPAPEAASAVGPRPLRDTRPLAALAAGLSPVLMNFGMKLSTDSPGLVLWPLAALLVLRLVKGSDARGWLAVGAVLGAAA